MEGSRAPSSILVLPLIWEWEKLMSLNSYHVKMTISISEVKDKPEKKKENADHGHWEDVGIFSMGTTSIAIVQ